MKQIGDLSERMATVAESPSEHLTEQDTKGRSTSESVARQHAQPFSRPASARIGGATLQALLRSGVSEEVCEVLSIVDSYGPQGDDLNESFRNQITLRDEVYRLALRDEIIQLTAVLDQARETLFVSIKGDAIDLQASLGKLNLACKAHWDWQTEKRNG